MTAPIKSALAALVLAFPGMASADTLNVAMAGDIRSTNFGVNRDGNTDTVLAHIVEGLVAYRDDLSVGPLLAQSWTVSEDGRVYTFTLRDGAVFHNGEPVTAADVVWSWERFLDEDTGFLCRRWYNGEGGTGIEITDIEALDDRTVAFTLAEPNGLFLARMAHMVCLTGIIHPDSVSADGEWINPIGTGPFTLGEWRSGQYVELNRFEDYVPVDAPADGYSGAREALVDSFRFTVISDPAAAKIAVLAGDIDVLPGLDLNAVPEVEATGTIEVQIVSTPGWEIMLVQNDDPLLQDVRIRQAMAHAIDITAVTEGATAGIGQPNPSAAARTGEFFNETFAQGLEYSPERARALLAEAGYDGEEITLISNTRSSFDEISAIAIQSMLQQVGMNVRLEILDWSSQFALYREGDFQLMVMSFSPRTDPTLMLDVVVDYDESRANAFVNDPVIVEMVSQSGAETDLAVRRAMLAEIHQLFIEDASVLGLFNHPQVVAVGDRVAGFEQWTLGKPRLWGVSVSD